MLCMLPPARNLAMLMPIVECIMLAYRAITFNPVKAKAEGLHVPTYFVSDVRKYVKARVRVAASLA